MVAVGRRGIIKKRTSCRDGWPPLGFPPDMNVRRMGRILMEVIQVEAREFSADPQEDLPGDSLSIRATKNVTALLTGLLLLFTIGFTMNFYGMAASVFLSEDRVETAEGSVEFVRESQGEVALVYYSFDAGGRGYRGRGTLSIEQARPLEPGSPLTVEYSRAMPSVHRLRGDEEKTGVRGGAVTAFAALMLLLLALVLCLCNWEHVYLFVRYYRATGKPAWVQVLRILHNVAFMVLTCLLVIAVVGVPASVSTGVCAKFWPFQAAIVVILLMLLNLLAKWTPFGRAHGARSPAVSPSGNVRGL